ncbi:MAG: bacteriocin [Clostridia bacterium]|nr:bacteriocin [Clostridia bacterium]
MTNNENLLKLIDEVNSDPEKIEQFRSKNSPQELYNYCISIVPGYTYDEFKEFMLSLADLISKNLSEDELNNIIGGTSKPWLNSAAKKFKFMLNS